MCSCSILRCGGRHAGRLAWIRRRARIPGSRRRIGRIHLRRGRGRGRRVQGVGNQARVRQVDRAARAGRKYIAGGWRCHLPCNACSSCGRPASRTGSTGPARRSCPSSGTPTASGRRRWATASGAQQPHTASRPPRPGIGRLSRTRTRYGRGAPGCTPVSKTGGSGFESCRPCAAPAKAGDMNLVNSTVDSMRPRPARRGCSGTTGTVTGPRLGRGSVEFDSPVPDAWVVTRLGGPDRVRLPAARHARQAQKVERRREVPEVARSIRAAVPMGRWRNGELAAFSARRLPVRSRHGLRLCPTCRR